MNLDEDNLFENYEILSDSSLSENENDYESIEWYSLGGFQRLNELSRQLRTYLNYKSSTILFKFSKSLKDNNNFQNVQIIKYKSNLFSLYRQYTTVIKDLGIEKEPISERIRNLINKTQIQPNNPDVKLLKEIKLLGSEIIKNLHILSEFELHYQPQ